MEITHIFVDCLQNIKSENKAIDEIVSHESKQSKQKSKYLPTSDQKKGSNFSTSTSSEFSRKINDLVKSINDMKKYLLDNGKDYINIYSPLLSLASMMTDRERDEIDADVENFIKICNDVIKVLRIDVKRRNNCQLSEHQSLVIDLVEKYLKMVCDIHSQQKAIRIKRAVEKQRLLRLGNIIANKNSSNESKTLNNPNKSKSKLNSDNKENESVASNSFPESNNENFKFETNSQNRTKTLIDSNDETYQQLELSKDELQMFEEENKHLYEEMNSLSDEVKDIEIKVIEIAKLQEIFTDNVLKQEIDLNKLSETTISSTENIRGGNEQLREAMRKNAGFRVWILFFITTLAFTILFLDWYND